MSELFLAFKHFNINYDLHSDKFYQKESPGEWPGLFNRYTLDYNFCAEIFIGSSSLVIAFILNE